VQAGRGVIEAGAAALRRTLAADDRLQGALSQIYDSSLFDPEEPRWPIQKRQLAKVGFTEEQIEEIDEWGPVLSNAEPNSNRPITAVATIDRILTQTVRYTPIGQSKGWEIGQPYVPMLVLPLDYPKRLILRITWIQ
jgi:hypothetical protein